MSKRGLDLIIEDLSELTIMEAAELVKRLKEKWGVSDVAAVAVAAGAPAAPAAAEKTEFNVTLKDIGPNKIEVIKIVRDETKLALKEAKDLVESLGLISKGVSAADAERIKKAFSDAGAAVTVS